MAPAPTFLQHASRVSTPRRITPSAAPPNRLFFSELQFNTTVLSPRCGCVRRIDGLILAETVGRQAFRRDPQSVDHVPHHGKGPRLAQFPVVLELGTFSNFNVVGVPV